MNLTHPAPQTLHDGLALLDAAPPQRTALTRDTRLRLTERVLDALPASSSPRLYWRDAFAWGGRAVVALGEVHCHGEVAAFAVDAACCTLHPAGLAERLVLALHLGERPHRVMPGTAGEAEMR